MWGKRRDRNVDMIDHRRRAPRPYSCRECNVCAALCGTISSSCRPTTPQLHVVGGKFPDSSVQGDRPIIVVNDLEAELPHAE